MPRVIIFGSTTILSKVHYLEFGFLFQQPTTHKSACRMVTTKMAETETTEPEVQVEEVQNADDSGTPSIIVAAQFLSEKIDDETILNRVKAATESENAVLATTILGEAFIRVLDCELTKEETGSVEGCMQELLIWIKEECKMSNEIVDRLTKELSNGKSRGDLRMKFIGLLYNSINEEDYLKRYELLNATISLATYVNLVSLIQKTVLPKVDKFLKLWDTTKEQKRETYRLCYEALKSVNDIEEAFSFNVKMLELFNHSDIKERNSISEAAVDAIVQAVRLPKLYRFDTLLELDVIKDFENQGGEKSLLYKLINIFVQDDLESFTAFYNDNGKFLEKFNINKDIAVDKMRLLTFASLGIESQDLSYNAIATALQIPEDLVEDWVIRAIGSGLVDAKINQLKSSVAIYRSTQRHFTREEWQPLSERINIWKANISDLLIALREMKQNAANSPVEGLV